MLVWDGKRSRPPPASSEGAEGGVKQRSARHAGAAGGGGTGGSRAVSCWAAGRTGGRRAIASGGTDDRRRARAQQAAAGRDDESLGWGAPPRKKDKSRYSISTIIRPIDAYEAVLLLQPPARTPPPTHCSLSSIGDRILPPASAVVGMFGAVFPDGIDPGG